MKYNAMNFPQVDTWVISLEKNYKTLPKLPTSAKEFIVSVTPWVTLVLGIISLIAWGLLAMVSVFTSPFLAISGSGFLVKTLIVAVIALVQGIYMVLAFQKTQNRHIDGWKLLTYVALLGLLSSVVSLSLFSILSGLLGAAIEFYFLFQIKSYYK